MAEPHIPLHFQIRPAFAPSLKTPSFHRGEVLRKLFPLPAGRSVENVPPGLDAIPTEDKKRGTMSKRRHWTLVTNTPAEMFPGRKRPGYEGRPGLSRLRREKNMADFRPADLNFAETGARGANETAGSPANIMPDLKDSHNISSERAGCSNDQASALDGETSAAWKR